MCAGEELAGNSNSSTKKHQFLEIVFLLLILINNYVVRDIVLAHHLIW